MQLSAVSSEHLNCPVFQEVLPKCLLVSKVSPFDFEYFVILLYMLKVHDSAGGSQVTFSFHISCVGGQRIFTIEKNVDGGITNTQLVRRFGP